MVECGFKEQGIQISTFGILETRKLSNVRGAETRILYIMKFICKMKVVVFTAIFGEKVPIDLPGPFEKINDWDYIIFTNFDADTFIESSWQIQKVDISLKKQGKYLYANQKLGRHYI